MAVQCRLHDCRHGATLRNDRDARTAKRMWLDGREGQRDAVGVIDEAEAVWALDHHAAFAGNRRDGVLDRASPGAEFRKPCREDDDAADAARGATLDGLQNGGGWNPQHDTADAMRQ